MWQRGELWSDRGGSEASVLELTVDQAVAMAVASNPDLAAKRARRDVAHERISAASQLENPQLRLSGFEIDELMEKIRRLPTTLPSSAERVTPLDWLGAGCVENFRQTSGLAEGSWGRMSVP